LPIQLAVKGLRNCQTYRISFWPTTSRSCSFSMSDLQGRMLRLSNSDLWGLLLRNRAKLSLLATLAAHPGTPWRKRLNTCVLITFIILLNQHVRTRDLKMITEASEY
jgi:hypothetical protein